MVQLREKDLPEDQRLELALQIKDAIDGRAILMVSRSLDLARACGSDGVHLPEDVPDFLEQKGMLGGEFLLGRSVHSLETAVEAHRRGVDYLIAGTIFDTRSHPGVKAAGKAFLRQLTREVDIPVLAIGGVNVDNAGEVMGAGASGVAVIRAVLASDNPGEAARSLWKALSQRAEARPLAEPEEPY